MENNIRLGKISAVDYAAGTVRVVYHEKDDAVTAPIPLISSEYFMPEVDDMVMVLHLSNGTEAGVVLGRPWSEKNKPPEGSKGLYRKDPDHPFIGGMQPPVWRTTRRRYHRLHGAHS